VANKYVREFMNEEWEFEIPTSFIDCVFLLLIFFILTAKFKSLERVLDGALPKDDGPNRVVEPVIRPQEIRVKIYWQDGAGRVISTPNRDRHSASIGIKANNQTCADLNDLARKLAEIGTGHPTTPVVIDARQHVPYRWVLGAVDACARAQIASVTFQAPAIADGGGSDWWHQ
jgi:biopolymer transport protein ExbD